MTEHQYAQQRNEKIRKMFEQRLERLKAFQDEWAYIFPIVKAHPVCNDVDSWCRANLDAVLDEDEVRDQVIAWAREHLECYEIHEKFIGMNDPDAAFWFKVTWQ